MTNDELKYASIQWDKKAEWDTKVENRAIELGEEIIESKKQLVKMLEDSVSEPLAILIEIFEMARRYYPEPDVIGAFAVVKLNEILNIHCKYRAQIEIRKELEN